MAAAHTAKVFVARAKPCQEGMQKCQFHAKEQKVIEMIRCSSSSLKLSSAFDFKEQSVQFCSPARTVNFDVRTTCTNALFHRPYLVL